MVLSGGSMEPPLCTNGSAGNLMQLSVKNAQQRGKMVPGTFKLIFSPPFSEKKKSNPPPSPSWVSFQSWEIKGLM